MFIIQATGGRRFKKNPAQLTIILSGGGGKRPKIRPR
jgi:hypothetical protein